MSFILATPMLMSGAIFALTVLCTVYHLRSHGSYSNFMRKLRHSYLTLRYKVVDYDCFRFGVRESSSSTFTTPHRIQALLDPPHTTPIHLLRQRAIPNEKLGRMFGLCNAFVSEDTKVRDRFVKDVKNKMKGRSVYFSEDGLGPDSIGHEWVRMRELIQIAIRKYAPSQTSSHLSFTTFVQSVTFTVICSFLFGIDIEKMNAGDVAVVTTGINSVWLDVKRSSSCVHDQNGSDLSGLDGFLPDTSSGAANHLVSEIRERMRLWFGDEYEQASQSRSGEGSPLNILIPAYETMWRAVAVALAYTATVSFGPAASEPIHPAKSRSSSQPSPHPSPGPGPCPCHPFPYPGPCPNPFPSPCPCRRSNSDSASCSYRRLFAAFFNDPTSSQFEAEQDGMSVKSVISEVLRLHGPVRRIARAIPVQASLSSSRTLPSWSVLGPFPLTWLSRVIHTFRILLLNLRSGRLPNTKIYKNGIWYTVRKADIQALHLNTTIWGPDAALFDPLRFSSTGSVQSLAPNSTALAAYLPFGYGPLKCKAAHWAPRVIGLIVSGVLEGLQFGGGDEENLRDGRESVGTGDKVIMRIISGPKVGGREGWEGWSMVRG